MICSKRAILLLLTYIKLLRLLEFIGLEDFSEKNSGKWLDNILSKLPLMTHPRRSTVEQNKLLSLGFNDVNIILIKEYTFLHRNILYKIQSVL